MKTLKYIGHISPFFFNRLPTCGMVKNDVVESGDSILKFVDESYPDGTEVTIRLSGRDFVCESTEDIENRKAAMTAMQEEYKRLANENYERRKQYIAEFNKSLNIPVKWMPQYRAVLSGLSEGGMGNGHYKNTVYHVKLLEPLTDGRLNRESGQPLCGGDWGKFGELGEWCEDESEYLEVTCKKCLGVAKRWQKGDKG